MRLLFLFFITINLFFSATAFSQIPSFTNKLVVNASSLNLRSAPGLNAEVLRMLEEGEVVEFIEVFSVEPIQIGKVHGYWLKVESSDQIEGYTFSAYLVNSIVLFEEYNAPERLPKLNWYSLHREDGVDKLKKNYGQS